MYTLLMCDVDGKNLHAIAIKGEPEVNVWGTRKIDVTPGFCPECERPLPGHYTNCPLHRSNR